MILNYSENVYTGMYDFAVSGGALSQIDLGVPIPKNTVITEFGVFVITAVLSAGAATVSFDIINTDVSPQTTTVGKLIAATGKATYAINAIVIPTIFSGTANFKTANSLSVGMTIAAAALTAGKLQFWCRGVTYDF